jgi:hypothetical protein
MLRRRPAAALSSPSQKDHFSQLSIEMESAELAARIAAAHEQAAAARRNTKLLDLKSIALDRKSESLPGSHTSSPKLPPTPNSADRPHLPLIAGDLTSGFMALLQTVQDNRQWDEAHKSAGDSESLCPSVNCMVIV